MGISAPSIIKDRCSGNVIEMEISAGASHSWRDIEKFRKPGMGFGYLAMKYNKYVYNLKDL
jgi:hypothetical protein